MKDTAFVAPCRADIYWMSPVSVHHKSSIQMCCKNLKIELKRKSNMFFLLFFLNNLPISIKYLIKNLLMSVPLSEGLLGVSGTKTFRSNEESEVSQSLEFVRLVSSYKGQRIRRAAFRLRISVGPPKCYRY